MPNPDPAQPHTYPRRILVAVEQYSPQTITEALYALSQITQPPWIPTEIQVITTERGRDQVQQALLEEGWLARLCADYALTAACSKLCFSLISDPNGKTLWDVRTKQDNEYAADFIIRQIRALTTDPQASVFALLSGGRRTMSYYIGYALSLCARPQDRLKHVLVDDCYFFLDDFYYPPPQTHWLQDRNGRVFDASTVEVMLADIPFVRLREVFPVQLLTGNSTFSDTIAVAQRRFAPVQVSLDWQGVSLTCGGVPVAMPPVQLAFYAWMLERRVQGLPPIHWTNVETPDFATQFLDVYARLHGKSGGYGQVAQALHAGMTRAWFDERKSNTHKALKQALGAAAAEPYLLHPHGKRPTTRFGLTLSPEAITFSNPKPR